MKAYSRRDTAPLILKHDTTWWRVVKIPPHRLYAQERIPPLNRRSGGPQRWAGRFGEERKSKPQRLLDITSSGNLADALNGMNLVTRVDMFLFWY
jgi:hypothetical protein